MSTITFNNHEETLAAALAAREKREAEGRLLDNEALDVVAAELRRLGSRTPKSMAPIAAAVESTGREVR
jgi:hypothetical protein